MRTPTKLFGATVAALIMIALASRVQAQAQKPDRGTSVTIGKAGVGESGSSALLVHKVQTNTQKLVVLRNVKSSLCGNTGAVAMLVVNGVPKVHGTITDVKSSIQVEVKPGDNIVAIVHAIPLFNNIVCIRLGELSFELQECGLAK